ncbi:MAG TPA: hypothetical protein VFQ70_02820, partial [Candidatus Saccharimonadaceae bacterium]|nr:hypothetical protein [Candidatus Saccharimonadaceae bacterium]
MNKGHEVYQHPESPLWSALKVYLQYKADILTNGASVKIASEPANSGDACDMYLIPQARYRDSTLILTLARSLSQTEITFGSDEPTVTHFKVTEQNQVLAKQVLDGDARQAVLDRATALLASDSATEIVEKQ